MRKMHFVSLFSGDLESATSLKESPKEAPPTSATDSFENSFHHKVQNVGHPFSSCMEQQSIGLEEVKCCEDDVDCWRRAELEAQIQVLQKQLKPEIRELNRIRFHS
jgi:hypothetical protein